jgi:hypothetical protein
MDDGTAICRSLPVLKNEPFLAHLFKHQEFKSSLKSQKSLRNIFQCRNPILIFLLFTE